MMADAFFTVNNNLRLSRLYASQALTDVDRLFNDLLMQTPAEAGKVEGCCRMCPSEEGLQPHHIMGWEYDHRTITACKSCHPHLNKQLDIRRKMFPVEVVKGSETLHVALLAWSFKDIAELKHTKTGNPIYLIVADRLDNSIISLLDQDKHGRDRATLLRGYKG